MTRPSYTAGEWQYRVQAPLSGPWESSTHSTPRASKLVLSQLVRRDISQGGQGLGAPPLSPLIISRRNPDIKQLITLLAQPPRKPRAQWNGGDHTVLCCSSLRPWTKGRPALKGPGLVETRRTICVPGPVPGVHCTIWLHPVTWDLLSFLFDR